jgi:hypothetical protein
MSWRMEKESSNILPVYDWFEVVCSDEVSAVEWTPQPIPKLTTKLLNIVRIQHVDLERSFYGTGNYELCGRYKRHI